MRTRFGVAELALFGSLARDESRPDSDVDVLVTFAGQPTFDDYMGLRIYLEDLFARKVDLGIRWDLRPALRSRIEAEAVRITIRDLSSEVAS
jgi:predicted nucleotidyltransferase